MISARKNFSTRSCNKSDENWGSYIFESLRKNCIEKIVFTK